MKRSPNEAYWEVVGEQYDNLLFLYRRFAAKRPVMLFDIQEQRIYAYPYRDYAADLSRKSQLSLARQYRAAGEDGDMVVFIRDNGERRLVSFSVPIKKNRTRPANRRVKS
jgi:hypothetical protein